MDSVFRIGMLSACLCEQSNVHGFAVMALPPSNVSQPGQDEKRFQEGFTAAAEGVALGGGAIVAAGRFDESSCGQILPGLMVLNSGGTTLGNKRGRQ